VPTTSRYLASTKNVPAIFKKMQEGVPPPNFNRDHLVAIGFAGSTERAIIPLLKDLGFLNGDGTPTQRYRDYRDTSRAKAVMAEALSETYADLFMINERLTKSDREAIEGRFKSLHGSSDRVAELQAATFLALLDLADLNAIKSSDPIQVQKLEQIVDESRSQAGKLAQIDRTNGSQIGFGYKIEITLPATKDVEVYNAIFKSLRENLLG
jgi:hypothetical protein